MPESRGPCQQRKLKFPFTDNFCPHSRRLLRSPPKDKVTSVYIVMCHVHIFTPVKRQCLPPPLHSHHKFIAIETVIGCQLADRDHSKLIIDYLTIIHHRPHDHGGRPPDSSYLLSCRPIEEYSSNQHHLLPAQFHHWNNHYVNQVRVVRLKEEYNVTNSTTQTLPPTHHDWEGRLDLRTDTQETGMCLKQGRRILNTCWCIWKVGEIYVCLVRFRRSKSAIDLCIEFRAA